MGRRYYWLTAAVIAGLALRLAQLPITRIPLGDNLNYWIIANNLLHGHGLLFVDPILGPQRAFFPPLYPLLLAATFLNPLAIVALNYAFDLCTALAMLWIGRLTQTEKSARLAAAVYLLWPTNVLLDPYPQKEGLVTLLCLLSAALALAQRWRLLGVAWGLLMLTQPGLAPLPALFILFVVPRSAWVPTLQAVPVAIMILLPWWIRNWIVFNAFVPLTTSSGFSLWIGMLPGSTGTWVPPPARFAIGEIAGNRAALHEALGFISADPVRSVGHVLAKVGHAFLDNSWPVRAFAISNARNATLLTLLVWITFIFNYAAAVSALLLRGTIGRLALAGLVQIVVIQAWFEMAERHRYFLTPFLLLGLCAAITKLSRRPLDGDARGRHQSRTAQKI